MSLGWSIRLSGLVLLAGAATACTSNSVQDAFGLQRRSPDEFQVVRRAPLVVPPGIELRPPKPGDPGPAAAQASPSAAAFAALTGQAPRQEGRMSAGERTLVAAAPGDPIANIREVIAEEDTQLALLDRGTFLFILNWQRDGAAQQPNVIDPVAEQRRLAAGGAVQTTRTASVPVTP